MKVLQLIICALSISACKQTPFKIIPLPTATEVDSVKVNESMMTYRTDYCLVQGDSRNISNSIWQYVSQNIDSTAMRYTRYDIRFYKESNSLNAEIIKKYDQKYKAFIDEKLIVTYTWYKGRMVAPRSID